MKTSALTSFDHCGLVDIDTYAVQLHLFSKQKKLIFKQFLEGQGIKIISIKGASGHANLAYRNEVERLINSLNERNHLEGLLQSVEGEL